MKKLVLVIGGPFAIVAAVSLGVYWWDRGAPPGFEAPLVDVALEEVSFANRGVRLKGTAHYDAKVLQTSSNGDSWTLYPLLPKGDTMAREAHIIVRTTRKVDPLYSFEDLTIEGDARPPGRLVPRAAREAIFDRGYSLTEDFVLVEERVAEP